MDVGIAYGTISGFNLKHQLVNIVETTSSDSNASEEFGNVAKAPRLVYEDQPANNTTATSPVVENVPICVSESWTVNDASHLYNVHGWSENYYSINEHGNLVVSPNAGMFPSFFTCFFPQKLQPPAAPLCPH